MTATHRRYLDLRNYRRTQRLNSHPICIVVSSQLNFRAEALKGAYPGAIVAITTQKDGCSVSSAGNAGIETILVGTESTVTGRVLTDIFCERGLRRIYRVGGLRPFRALLSDQVVHRLGLTLAGRLSGGNDIEIPVHGPLFATPLAPTSAIYPWIATLLRNRCSPVTVPLHVDSQERRFYDGA